MIPNSASAPFANKIIPADHRRVTFTMNRRISTRIIPKICVEESRLSDTGTSTGVTRSHFPFAHSQFPLSLRTVRDA